MSILHSIDKAFKKKADRGYPYMYWAIDVHDTLVASTYSEDVDDYELYDNVKETLQLLSKMPDMKLIIYSCSYLNKTKLFIDHLRTLDIEIDYVNENPECISTGLSDFSQKLYFDVMIDDKAGFHVKDWFLIYQYLYNLNK